MNTRHTRILTLTWPSGKPVKLRDIARALRDLPADAEATSIEPTTVEYVDASHVGLRIEYTIEPKPNGVVSSMSTATTVRYVPSRT